MLTLSRNNTSFEAALLGEKNLVIDAKIFM